MSRDAVLADCKKLTDALVRGVEALHFEAPVAYVYNPLVYARPMWDAYLERYANRGVEAVLLGMNPGPFGMAQTGIPFGEVSIVREWLELSAPIGKPKREHPKRPVTGLACTRSEVSGARLWGWAQTLGTPKTFFKHFFVANYCPLVFMDEGGRNLTPDKLPAKEREALEKVCNNALAALVRCLSPRWVIGVGAFAESKAREVLASSEGSIQIGRIPHPSPASPSANRDWLGQAQRALKELGVRAS